MRPTLRIAAAFSLLGLPCAQADIALPHIISNHMVLLRAADTPLWGTARPGEKVRATFGEISAEAVTDPTGHWRLILDLTQAPASPQTVVLEGANRVEIQDVLVGEVWICAGQSNMAFELKLAEGADEDIAKSANPLLRHFRVKGPASPVPKEDCSGTWEVAVPENIGPFTAVGYYFGRRVQAELGTPMGLICPAVGGTPSEAWTSMEGITTDPELKADADLVYRQWQVDAPKAKADFVEKLTAWQAKYNRQDVPVTDPTLFITGNPADWAEVKLPGKLSASGLPAGGSVWLRKTFEISFDPATATEWALELAIPAGPHIAYCNGTKIGGNDDWGDHATFGGSMRRYVIPVKLLKQGTNEIAARVFHPGDELGITGADTRLKVTYLKDALDQSFNLVGPWRAKMETALPPLEPSTKTDFPPLPAKPPNGSHVAGALFNSLINPLIPYGIRGAVWYQGENNTGRAYRYRTAFPLMIRDWRARWGRGDFPFYFCQLANMSARKPQPAESDWAELREAQLLALSLPNTGQAVLIDIGEAGNIHPRNKREAGERLARLALAGTYDRKIVATGPLYAGMTVEEGCIRIRFTGLSGKLVSHPVPTETINRTKPRETVPFVRNSPTSELEGFAICGEDRRWVWAEARIDGETVVVSSNGVSKPVAVRYGWANNPVCTLYDADGLPASPFRTDDFPGLTINARYGDSP